MLTKISFLAVFCILPLAFYAQKGPGGVSVETGSQSTCRAWLDASTLTALADGDDLTEWPDISPSTKNDKATPKNNALPPYFRDDAANTINGYPVVTFEDDRFLLMTSTSDLNLTSITHSKTVFFAFRSSTDVTSRQVLFEEGGCYRGFNIYIENNDIYVGAYDLNDHGLTNNGTTKDSDGTPQFGYTFVKKHVDANNTYILSVQFYAENTGVVADNSSYYIKGWLNGQVFDVMDKTTGDHTNPSVGNAGIGTLFAHPNPIGLGAVNDDIVIIDGAYCSNTGDFTFQGRLAEVIYYNDRLTETQRIIIENYLGAKYFANFIVNDKYEHQANYGVEVIGIGQETNSSANRHNLSQGRNPFMISAASTSSYNHSDQYFLTGHNGASLTLTSSGVPNNSPVIQRLQRIWRVDERNTFGSVRIKINSDDIPAAPVGYSKLVLLVDETSINFPNFSLASTVVKEIPISTGTIHQVDYDFADNAFYTFAWLKPQVEFAVSESSALEGDSPPLPLYSTFTVPVTLNYQPVSPTANKVGYHFEDAGQTAEAVDYQYTIPVGGLNIPASTSTANISLGISNDNFADEESTEQFLIILDPGSPTTSGLGIGERDTLVFYILDDDPPPNGSFVSTSANISEGVDSIYIKVQRTGDPSFMSTTASKIRVRRKASPDQGTATYNTDYGLLAVDNWKGSPASRVDTVAFPAASVSSQIDSIKVMITDDIINEADETVFLILEGAVDIAIDATSKTEFQLNIIENDPLPQATFLVDNQTGYESNGAPVILVKLDRSSSRDVTVYYSIDTDVSTADYESDYTGSLNGSILFPAGDTLGYPSPFNVDNGDLPNEPDQTVIFHLDSAINATIGGAGSMHTYTIIDYAPFEWKGAAGVGKNSDNIVWVDANRMTPLGIKTSLDNYSPRDIPITRKGGDNNRATLIANGINNRQSLEFDGIDNSGYADVYQIKDNSFINLAGTCEKKAFFFVVKPTDVPSGAALNNATPNSSNCRLIYEEGGNSRGVATYFYNSKLYFHAWNYPNAPVSGENLWGMKFYTGSSAQKVASAVYAVSAQNIVVNTPYIITCIFDELSDEPLMVYVNGRKGVMSGNIMAPGDVGKLYGHSGDIGLGGFTNQGIVHFTAKAPAERSCPFKGLLSEMIMFQEPQLNDARRIIIENYLSAKYDIPLYTSDTRQIFDLNYADLVSDPTNAFNNDVAGIGQIITPTDTLYHGDAQGTAILRIKDPTFSADVAFLEWGHNGKSLTDTWPYSYWNADLPDGIEERSGLVWKLFESPNGTVTTADIYINFSASANAAALNDPMYLKLLINSSSDPNDFSGAAVRDVTGIRSGNVAYFNDVPINNGDYITLGNTSPITLFPLPIELLNFDAKFEVDHVNISWATASEMNNEYFDIERAGSDLKWEKIAEVAGAGNSNTTLYYNEKDRNPLSGISYYRLRQVDFDGKYKYSDVVSVVNSQEDNTEEVFIYPNPVSNGTLVLRIPYAVSDSKTTVTIYDLTGKKVWTQILPECEMLMQINVDRLRPGAYLVNVNSALLDETRKLIVN